MSSQRQRKTSSERGSVILMAAISMTILLLMVGLCIDISRIYVTRAELQNAADAAALTAARELNGGTTGISSAVAKANAIVNTAGLKTKSTVTLASVEFGVNLDDEEYMDAATAGTTANAPNINYVRVTTETKTTSIIFGLKALGTSHVENRSAIAGRSVEISGICDFFPAAVALTSIPAPGTLLTLNFNQGTGNEAVLVNNDFIILEVPDLTGNGTVETAVLAAGLRNYCKKLGDNINMTPSSNPNNGPRNSGDGMNTRFGVYANGYGNQLQPGRFPSDTNVTENISHQQYLNGSPEGNERREIVMPIISPGTYPAYTTNIIDWGIFFLRAKVPTPNGNCSATPGCGSMPVEYVGKAEIASAFGDPSCDSGLTLPVLYR